MNDLDVRRLRILYEVALRGTIVAAAQALGFTPSAISQQLSALERETGTALLERTGRGVRLTDAGRILVARTEPILVALEDARAALEESRSSIAGELRIATTGSLARGLVYPSVAELATELPGLKVTVFEYEPRESLREVRLGTLDLVVAHEYQHDRGPAEPGLTRVDLFTEQMLVVAPAGRFAGPVRLADLALEVWAAEPVDSACGRAVRLACRAAGFEPDIRYISSESGVALSAVAVAGAVTLVPGLGLTSSAEYDALEVADAHIDRLVFAAHRSGSALRPGIRLLLQRLHATAADVR